MRGDRFDVARAFASCCGATVLIGTLVAVSPWVSSYPVLAGQGWRYALAAAVLLVVLHVRGEGFVRPTVGEWARLSAVAATGMVGFNVLVVLATRRCDPGAVGAIVGCSPLILALIPALRARRRPQRRLVGAAAMVVAGVALVEGVGGTDPVGLVLAGGALAGEALFSLLAVPLLPRLGSLRMSAYACVAAVGLLGVVAPVVPGPDLVVPSGRELAALVYLALVATAVAFVLWYRGLERLGPERAGVCVGLVPVSALVTGLALGTADAGVAALAGCCLVGAGLAASAWAPRRAQAWAPRRAQAWAPRRAQAWALRAESAPRSGAGANGVGEAGHGPAGESREVTAVGEQGA